MPKSSGTSKPDDFISKGRLDGLSDGVFAFAMTLLVVNIEFPDNFAPKSGGELLAGLAGRADVFIAYIVTFFVLASFWLVRARTKEEPQAASAAYAWAVIFHLFAVTFLRFAMPMVGRYIFPAATCIYAGNMMALALTSMAISLVVERDSGRPGSQGGRIELGFLLASALLSMAISLVARDYAMYAYLLNLGAPLAARMLNRPQPA